jgi:Kef-type K+ transport system membrane component KefB
MSWTLPSFVFDSSLQWNGLLLFGGLLVLGLVGGQLASRYRWLPRMTGYLLAGVALGPSGLNWLPVEVLKLSGIFADVAVALVMYQLGRYLDLGWLRHEKWLLATVVSGALLCFVLVWGVLELLGLSRALAMLAGVLAIATAPAVVLVVVRDLGAEGQVTRRLAAMTALNNLVALLAAYALLPLVGEGSHESPLLLLSHTLYGLCGSLLLAYLMYRLLLLLARWLGRQGSRQFVLVIGVITLAIGAAHTLQLPVILTMLAFAILSRNLDQRYELADLEFGAANDLLIVLLFVSIGATMQLSGLAALGLPVAALIIARLAASAGSIFLFAKQAKLRWSQAALLTLGTLPMAEAGLGLMQAVATLYPRSSADIAPLLAGCLLVLELLGPIATQFALIRSGEGGHTTT